MSRESTIIEESTIAEESTMVEESTTEQKKECEALKLQYLEMVQSNIERMATSSALFKGFAATIVSGISALSYNEVNNWILIMSFIPVIGFMIMDLYYLYLERKYRYLYEEIRTGKKELNFNLSLEKFDKEKKKNARVRLYQLLMSPSFYFFYPILIVICLTVTILKLNNLLCN